MAGGAQPCRLGAPDYESGGQEFESLRARHLSTELGTPKPAVFALESGNERAQQHAFGAHDANLFRVDLDALGECTQVVAKSRFGLLIKKFLGRNQSYGLDSQTSSSAFGAKVSKISIPRNFLPSGVRDRRLSHPNKS